MKATRLLSDAPERRILKPEQIDDLGQAVLALTREVWLVTDRMLVLERVLEARGLSVTAEIDAFIPDAEFAADLEARRNRLLEAVLTALRAAPAG
jgi:uncharacterized ferritin-like protein (DUF455 family)